MNTPRTIAESMGGENLGIENPALKTAASGNAAVEDKLAEDAEGRRPSRPATDREFRRILGVPFFLGTARQAFERIRVGGLLVVPAAPALKDLPLDREYRNALMEADLAITDSSLMVLFWNLIERDNIPRVSGLSYFRELAIQSDLLVEGGSYWVMAGKTSVEKNLKWLRSQGIPVSTSDIYIAPFYGSRVVDELLLQNLRERPVRHIIITIGGGVQEKLGLYLKRNLGYQPSIHCVGAAIAFVSGDQVYIPEWADKLMLGWLFRCLSSPFRFLPRYYGARTLLSLIFRYRDRFPPEAL